MTNYLDLSIKEINDLLKNKKIKPIDLVNECFLRIDKYKEYNAFITTCKESAIKRALELENMEVDNLLFGIPIALKDNIITKDIKTTCASKMLKDFIPTYDASVVDLINEKHMIIVGKLNMDEFAMGSTNETSYFGPVLNSIDKSRTSGGSSGGPATSVGLNIVPISLGSDTGGSIRQPSAYNGIVGFKPTYGRVSRYGLVAFASSLDAIGPITRNVYESALMLNAICKKDDKDLTTTDTLEDFTSLIGEDVSGMKIAIPKFFMNDTINSDIKNEINKVIDKLKNSNVVVDYVDMPYIEYSVPLYQVIALAEASSNLARFDGVRYGYQTKKDVSSVDEFYEFTRSEGFGEEVKRRIMIGSYVLSGENVKDYYYKALKVRKCISNEFNKIFNNYDLIIGPTTTDFPRKVYEKVNALTSFQDDILTIPVNMAGLPAISIPINKCNNLSVGMQIIGKRFDEKTIYKLASYVEELCKK